MVTDPSLSQLGQPREDGVCNVASECGPHVAQCPRIKELTKYPAAVICAEKKWRCMQMLVEASICMKLRS
eukprot:6499199-Pyramimonas_sp.AAC.1